MSNAGKHPYKKGADEHGTRGQAAKAKAALALEEEQILLAQVESMELAYQAKQRELIESAKKRKRAQKEEQATTGDDTGTVEGAGAAEEAAPARETEQGGEGGKQPKRDQREINKRAADRKKGRGALPR